MIRPVMGAALLALLAAALAAPVAADEDSHDYPTADRADYVLGCMPANGNSRLALLKCSRPIDSIARQMSYAEYEKAQTALGMLAGGGVGGRAGLFRDPPELKAVVEKLHRAQADADLHCF
jgi:hypothetical protein